MAHSELATAFYTRIGKRIRYRRRVMGLTQADLGSACNPPIRFQQIQKYETGANYIDLFKLHAICKVLNIPITFFMLEDMETPEPLDTTLEDLASAEQKLTRIREILKDR